MTAFVPAYRCGAARILTGFPFHSLDERETVDRNRLTQIRCRQASASPLQKPRQAVALILSQDRSYEHSVR